MKRVLLVEGVDDEHVMKHLFRHGGLPRLDDIANVGGVDRLLETFPVRLKESDVIALGVVIDADTNLANRWQSLRDRLRNVGYNDVPDLPHREGTVLGAPVGVLLPRVGIWIMPNNYTSGQLEDFLRFLIPAGSRLFEHAESSVNSIPIDERRFEDNVRSKVVLHTWLAWQQEPGRPLGIAITARFLDPNVPEVDVLIAWLRRLFFEGD